MSVSEYRVPLWRRMVRPLMMGALRLIFHLLSSVTVTGKENVPRGQAYMVAINHVSTFDPPLAGAFWPELLEAIGAVEVWHRPGQKQLVGLYGGIPVHRGDYDRTVFDRALSALRSGRPLLMAPEGGRTHKPGLARAKPGVAFLLEEARVPIIPVGIVGTTDNFWKRASHGQRPHVEMHIGQPVSLPPIEGKGAARREARQRNADLLMSYIAGLLPEGYRGVYADSAIEPFSETYIKLH